MQEEESVIPPKQDRKPADPPKAEVKREAKVKLLKKVDPDTARLLASLKEKANKKSYGRKITEGEIIAIAVREVKPDHLKTLQEQSYSEQDRLKMAHEAFQKKHGKLTLDQFVGKLLRGEVAALNGVES